MEKVRDIGVLLPLIKEEFIKIINIDKNYSGMCRAIASLFINDNITFGEKLNMEFYLIANIPVKCKHTKGVSKLNYYWFDLNDIESRINWLDEHIKLNTDINGKEKD
jgi:hypothetical protein